MEKMSQNFEGRLISIVRYILKQFINFEHGIKKFLDKQVAKNFPPLTSFLGW